MPSIVPGKQSICLLMHGPEAVGDKVRMIRPEKTGQGSHTFLAHLMMLSEPGSVGTAHCWPPPKPTCQSTYKSTITITATVRHEIVLSTVTESGLCFSKNFIPWSDWGS